MSSVLAPEISLKEQPISKAIKPAKELTARQIENRKNLAEEKTTTDILKNRRNILLKEMEPLIDDVKSWYANSKRIYSLDNNKILTFIWRWDPESIRYDIFDGDIRIKPKAIQLKKLQEELHAIGNSYLTRKELNAEYKAFKNRVKTSEEIKADMFHAMGN
jgi:hypothetical protein